MTSGAAPGSRPVQAFSRIRLLAEHRLIFLAVGLRSVDRVHIHAMGRAAVDLAVVQAIGQISVFLRPAEDEDERPAFHPLRQPAAVADDALEREGEGRSLETDKLADMRLEVIDRQKLVHGGPACAIASGPRVCRNAAPISTPAWILIGP